MAKNFIRIFFSDFQVGLTGFPKCTAPLDIGEIIRQLLHWCFSLGKYCVKIISAGLHIHTCLSCDLTVNVNYGNDCTL